MLTNRIEEQEWEKQLAGRNVRIWVCERGGERDRQTDSDAACPSRCSGQNTQNKTKDPLKDTIKSLEPQSPNRTYYGPSKSATTPTEMPREILPPRAQRTRVCPLADLSGKTLPPTAATEGTSKHRDLVLGGPHPGSCKAFWGTMWSPRSPKWIKAVTRLKSARMPGLDRPWGKVPAVSCIVCSQLVERHRTQDTILTWT